jgi:hypothetical protein
MITTSRLGNVDSARMLPATFSAGENLVDEGLGVAESTVAVRRERSDVERSWISAPDPKKTTDPRSDALIPAIRSRAAACACDQ